jgi:amino acid adenylation domain-containing protein
MSLANLIFKNTIDYRDLIAINCQGQTITYSDLNTRSLKLASLITDYGFSKETVAIIGKKKISSYVAILGTLYAGCNYTPLNDSYNITKTKKILDITNAKIIIGESSSLEKLEKKGIDFSKFIIITNDYLDKSNFKSISQLNILKSPLSNNFDDLCYILFTSGSTGEPKGVKINNSNILEFIKNMSKIYDLKPGFRASQTFDFSFDPSVSDIFFTWFKGGELCVLPEEEKLIPTDFIKREKINFWNSVPSIAVFMEKMGHLTANNFPDLKHSMFCGEQFPKYIADSWKQAAPNSTIENLYGPTEATIYISRFNYLEKFKENNFKNGILPIGNAFENHDVIIIDEDFSELKHGEIGEICFSGKQLSTGYLRDLKKSNDVFVNFKNKRWYKTGDLGFKNKMGYVECIGRKDNQIKISGRRIEIGEIEFVLSKFKKTKNAVVIPVRDEREIVIGCVAFIIESINKEEVLEIRSKSTQYLDKVFFPKRIITIENFPLNNSGKIDRKKLKNLL